VPDHGFSLALPAGWVQRLRSEAGADVFQSADGSAQVTVSSFSAASRMKAADRDQMLTRLLEHRRNAERQGMGPRMTTGEPQRTARGEVVSARYEGHDMEAGHRFATLVVVSAAGA
jgi:hypothetical protein